MFPLKLVFMFNCLFEMRSDTVRCLVLPSLLQSKKQSRFTEINPRPWSIQQRAILNLPTCSSFCAGSNQSFVPFLRIFKALLDSGIQMIAESFSTVSDV